MTVAQMRQCLKEEGVATWSEKLPAPGYVAPATKGSAMLWYNYRPEHKGHQQELAESEHCGCDIVKGEKWGTNLWLADVNIFHKASQYISRVAQARRIGRKLQQ